MAIDTIASSLANKTRGLIVGISSAYSNRENECNHSTSKSIDRVWA